MYSRPRHIDSHHYKAQTPTPKCLTRDKEELKKLKEQVQDLSSKLQDKHKSVTPHAKEMSINRQAKEEKPEHLSPLGDW